jgi:hypothetical protein
MSRLEADPGRFQLTCAGVSIECTPSGLPLTYDRLKVRAALVDEFEIHEGNLCCLTVRRCGESWPFLIVAQSYSPAGAGFEPGALFVPDTNVLFLGAGERILAYSLAPLKRLWEDHADTGFLGWDQQGNIVLLTAELEFAAWDTLGRKLWTMSVEPPWSYAIRGGTIELDVMGNKQSFGLQEGPPRSASR